MRRRWSSGGAAEVVVQKKVEHYKWKHYQGDDDDHEKNLKWNLCWIPQDYDDEETYYSLLMMMVQLDDPMMNKYGRARHCGDLPPESATALQLPPILFFFK